MQAKEHLERWGTYADDYDRRRFALHPGYEQMLEIMCDSFPYGEEERFRCLEIGTGTGNLALRVLERFKHAELTGLDVTAEMLSIAAQKIAPFGERVTLRQADILSEGPSSQYDVIISSLLLHCMTADRQRALVGAMRHMLEPGGVIIHGDVLMMPPGFVAEQNRRIWNRRKAAALAAGEITAEELVRETARRGAIEANAAAKSDHFWTADEYRSLFRDAGFGDAELIWRHYGLAVVIGQV